MTKSAEVDRSGARTAALNLQQRLIAYARDGSTSIASLFNQPDAKGDAKQPTNTVELLQSNRSSLSELRATLDKAHDKMRDEAKQATSDRTAAPTQGRDPSPVAKPDYLAHVHAAYADNGLAETKKAA